MPETSYKAESARRLRVFICHSSTDKPEVRSLCRRLREDGFDPWLDEEELLPGQEWQEEIPRAVRASDVVIVCLSRNSISKEGYLQREIRDALYVAEEKPEGTVFIIPVRLQRVEVPRRLSQWQWANLFEEHGYGRLIRTLAIRAEKLGAYSPVKPRSAESRGLPPATDPERQKTADFDSAVHEKIEASPPGSRPIASALKGSRIRTCEP